MAYDRFDELITARYHVIVKNWPLKKFCNPSAVTSRIELELLYNSWRSGATSFQKLTDGEMEAWESSRFSSRIELMPPPAELVPALISPQILAEMTTSSELPHQEHSYPDPIPSTHIIQNPLAPITNLASGLALTTPTSPPQAADPDTIAMMIRADPTLQNVDPTLIAMGIAGSSQRQATTIATPPVERPSSGAFHANGPKRRWQEVVTPLSFDAHAAKKPRKQRKDKQPQNPLIARDSEN